MSVVNRRHIWSVVLYIISFFPSLFFDKIYSHIELKQFCLYMANVFKAYNHTIINMYILVVYD